MLAVYDTLTLTTVGGRDAIEFINYWLQTSNTTLSGARRCRARLLEGIVALQLICYTTGSKKTFCKNMRGRFVSLCL